MSNNQRQEHRSVATSDSSSKEKEEEEMFVLLNRKDFWKDEKLVSSHDDPPAREEESGVDKDGFETIPLHGVFFAEVTPIMHTSSSPWLPCADFPKPPHPQPPAPREPIITTFNLLSAPSQQIHKILLEGEYTTAFALFEGLWEVMFALVPTTIILVLTVEKAGITTCFVNVGSDHPSIIEAIVKGKRQRPDRWPRMITCPSEVIAISMADGYARVTGQPQAVIVHVDVGTQALGQGIHNASVGRVPIFIFAGLCPYTESGELLGSRTEYMHWLQDPHDQAAIVRQYCRYTGEIRTGLNIKQTIGRALQFANSAPKGPVYITSAREVLAQEIRQYSLQQDQWIPIGPTDLIPGIRVHDTGGSDVCFPFTHIASEGSRFSTHECTKDADVILLLDCDVPWIPSRNPPPKNAKIYHVDIDPLNQQIPVSFFPAHGRWKADCYTALTQLLDHIKSDNSLTSVLQDKRFEARRTARAVTHKNRVADIASQLHLNDGDQLDAHNIGNLLKTTLPGSTTFVVEAVTSAQTIYDQLQPDRPGSWINCGGTGIGWSNGAVLGVKMALADTEQGIDKPSLVCQVVGDGSFMCAAPSSALWVASRYEIPVLTVVLNNGGWKAPRNSTQLVYPNGLNTTASDGEINVSFRPTPNYAALAEAAAGSETHLDTIRDESGAWMKGLRVQTVAELREVLHLAKSRVAEEGKGMLIEILM
ncbi:thiamine pyrophosphate enzyme [Xylaria arbuscula]|nr:thiamine pyrophosphate enzyme [Xylaria arbuscula]